MKFCARWQPYNCCCGKDWGLCGRRSIKAIMTTGSTWRAQGDIFTYQSGSILMFWQPKCPCCVSSWPCMHLFNNPSYLFIFHPLTHPSIHSFSVPSVYSKPVLEMFPQGMWITVDNQMSEMILILEALTSYSCYLWEACVLAAAVYPIVIE